MGAGINLIQQMFNKELLKNWEKIDGFPDDDKLPSKILSPHCSLNIRSNSLSDNRKKDSLTKRLFCYLVSKNRGLSKECSFIR